VLYTNYPTDVTIERAGSDDLTYSVAGAGVDYAWDGDTFTATATSVNATSQVIVATDGCTIDTLVWDPQVEPGVVTIDVVHLVPGAGEVNFGVTGEDSLATLGFEDRERVVLPFGDYGFDVRVRSAPIASVEVATFEPGTNHVMVVHTDGENVSMLPVDLGADGVADPESDLRLVGVHAAAETGEVDVYDVYGESVLFEDLAYGTADDLGDVPAVDYGLAIDFDDDGETDLDLGRLSGADFVGNRVVASAYVTALGQARIFAVDVDADVDAIISTNLELTLEPGTFFDDTTDPYQESITVSGCPEVGAVNVEVDITHSYRGDIVMDLEGPAGGLVTLWNEEGSYFDDIYGEFDADAGTDLSGGGDDDLFTRSGLVDFEGASGNGEWTLTVADVASISSGTVNSWTLRLECPL